MKFKVKDIGEGGVDVDLAVTAAWLAEVCAGTDVSGTPEDLRFTGVLERSGEDYLLRGKLRGRLSTPCARCLEPAGFSFDEDINVVFVEKERLAKDEADETVLDAPEVLTFSDGVIDLSEELREELLLALPPSVLCAESCLGLCPVCGGNRNQNPCSCVEQERMKGSKFATLAKLKS